MKLTRAKSSAIDDRFRLFSLKTNVELEEFNVTVQLLSGLSNFGIGVPLQESGVG